MSEKNFETLLAELASVQEDQTTLTKSMAAEGADDTAIQAAAAGGAEGEEINPEDAQGELAKSQAAAAAGEEVTVIEGEEIIKSLTDLDGRTSAVEETLVKGLGAAIDMIKGQGELIKSLQGQVAKLAGQGAGRRAVLTVTEKPAVGEQLMKSQGASDVPSTKEELMAKATAAWDAKKISGVELTSFDVALRSNQVPDRGVLAKILS